MIKILFFVVILLIFSCSRSSEKNTSQHYVSPFLLKLNGVWTSECKNSTQSSIEFVFNSHHRIIIRIFSVFRDLDQCSDLKFKIIREANVEVYKMDNVNFIDIRKSFEHFSLISNHLAIELQDVCAGDFYNYKSTSIERTDVKCFRSIYKDISTEYHNILEIKDKYIRLGNLDHIGAEEDMERPSEFSNERYFREND